MSTYSTLDTPAGPFTAVVDDAPPLPAVAPYALAVAM